jgi:methionyl-tRNA formyltransferase
MKIALLGCKGTTLDLLNSLTGTVSFDTVITLPEDLAVKNKVAFYRANDIRQFCAQKNINCHFVKSYSLKNESDMEFFSKSNFDLMFVIGWERLIPSDILKSLNKYACGMHGSPFGLPRGRGRSPLNWSIITRKNRFITYLFRYKPGMDDGDIIGFKAFDVNEFDTIGSLHQKNRMVMGELIREYLPVMESGKETLWHQPPENPTFYPKRTAEDGFIDWTRSTDGIYNLIRAVSFPYPSAFTYLNDTKIIINKAFPFDNQLFPSHAKPGEIIDVSVALGNFIVKTGNGTLNVTDYEGMDINNIKRGMVLTGSNMEEIIRDIQTRYPDFIQDEQKEI